MAVTQMGKLFGTGGTNFTVVDSMMADSEHSYTMVHPWRVKSSGSFYNCSYVNSTTVALTNPATIDVFTFFIEYSYGSDIWEELELEGTLYASLGATNISMNNVRTVIGESSCSLSGLCSSVLVNRYSEYCPDGNSPYRLGDFRWYAHDTGYGVALTTNASTSTIAWNGSKTITGYISKYFKSPYSFTQCRTAFYKDGILSLTDSSDLSSVNGEHFSLLVNNNKYNQDTETFSCSLKAEQYSGSAWVAYDTHTFNLTFTGSPWGVCEVTSEVHAGNDYDVTFTFTGSLSNVRLTISGEVSGVPRTATNTDTGGITSPYTITVTSPLGFDGTVEYVLDTEISSTWYTLAVGEFA